MIRIEFQERKGGNRCYRGIISQLCFQPKNVFYRVPDKQAPGGSSPSFLET